MAYTIIPDIEFAEGSPVKGITGLALRNNIGELVVVDGGVAKVQIPPPMAGSTYTIYRLLGASDEIGSGDSAGYNAFTRSAYGMVVSPQNNLGVTCLCAGIITCNLQHQRNIGGTAYARVLKNGAVVQEWSTTSSTFQSRSVNVSVSVGDFICFQQRSSIAVDDYSKWRDVRISSDNPYLAVA